MVKCIRLGREAEGLDRAPWPGELGQRIYDNVSKEAWREWIGEATKLLNETRLDPTSPAAQEFYGQKMQEYFFGSGAPPVPGH
jgi:Fe-S cluster biosynthesis and repair protein YggX